MREQIITFSTVGELKRSKQFRAKKPTRNYRLLFDHERGKKINMCWYLLHAKNVRHNPHRNFPHISAFCCECGSIPPPPSHKTMSFLPGCKTITPHFFAPINIFVRFGKAKKGLANQPTNQPTISSVFCECSSRKVVSLGL